MMLRQEGWGGAPWLGHMMAPHSSADTLWELEPFQVCWIRVKDGGRSGCKATSAQGPKGTLQ